MSLIFNSTNLHWFRLLLMESIENLAKISKVSNLFRYNIYLLRRARVLALENSYCQLEQLKRIWNKTNYFYRLYVRGCGLSLLVTFYLILKTFFFASKNFVQNFDLHITDFLTVNNRITSIGSIEVIEVVEHNFEIFYLNTIIHRCCIYFFHREMKMAPLSLPAKISVKLIVFICWFRCSSSLHHYSWLRCLGGRECYDSVYKQKSTTGIKISFLHSTIHYSLV